MKRKSFALFAPILTIENFSLTFVVSFFYLVLSTLLLNYRLLYDTFINPYPWQYKAYLPFSLFTGTLWGMPLSEASLLLLISILVGINTTLLINVIGRMRHQGNLKLATGGSSLVALASAGCSSCGISLLSVIGVSSAIVPLRTLPLQYLTLGLLTFSLAYSVRKIQDRSCKIT